jgi:hypothetical protein
MIATQLVGPCLSSLIFMLLNGKLGASIKNKEYIIYSFKFFTSE